MQIGCFYHLLPVAILIAQLRRVRRLCSFLHQSHQLVMAALEAAIQSARRRAAEDSLFCWMAGSSPAMTKWEVMHVPKKARALSITAAPFQGLGF
jgi:hypothetical protein